YRKQWNLTYSEEKQTHSGSMVVLWHNGLSPVKSEWSINFTILPGEVGFVTFVNEEWGVNFPFYVGNSNDRQKLTDLKIVRMAIHKFIERPTVYSHSSISVAGKKMALEQTQNINGIAIQNLKDRMLREFGVALLRLALKQAAETAARKSDKE